MGKIYDPSRKALSSISDYTAANFNVASCLLKDWVSSGEVKSVNEILPGSGAIMREGTQKVAVYRDENGNFKKCSAVCTHIGCIVHWNPIEKSWDCPCHGSRFTVEGQILNGPATRALKRK